MKALELPATVHLVEDNVDNRVITKAWLEHAGYRVLLADDGLTSIALAGTEAPDVILMDVTLPGIDGWCGGADQSRSANAIDSHHRAQCARIAGRLQASRGARDGRLSRQADCPFAGSRRGAARAGPA